MRFWIGGELMGFIVGTLLGLQGLAAYPVALGFAGIGVFVAWQIVKALPELQPSAT